MFSNSDVIQDTRQCFRYLSLFYSGHLIHTASFILYEIDVCYFVKLIDDKDTQSIVVSGASQMLQKTL